MAISRREMYMALGLLEGLVEPLTKDAFKTVLEKNWREDLENAPHGHPWHTSFHASQIGDRCARKAIYTLMNVPEPEPFSQRSKLFMELGKGGELALTDIWAKAGLLISTDQNVGGREEVQLGFEDPDIWMTGNADALLLPRGWNRPHPVEVKYMRHQSVKELQVGLRQPPLKHVEQLKSYICGLNQFLHINLPWVKVCKETGWVSTEIVGGECRLHGKKSCLVKKKLDPVIDGSLFYVALDDPAVTREFYFTLDESWWAEVRTDLKAWQTAFKDGILPPRPKEWRWTEDPCKWCPFKKGVCKPDHKAKVTKLADSHALPVVQKIRPDYNYDETRQEVLGRWERQSASE